MTDGGRIRDTAAAHGMSCADTVDQQRNVSELVRNDKAQLPFGIED